MLSLRECVLYGIMGSQTDVFELLLFYVFLFERNGMKWRTRQGVLIQCNLSLTLWNAG